MPQLFQRQTLNREVTGLVQPEPTQLPLGAPPITGDVVPQERSQIDFPPEVQTQNIEIQGPNRGINLAADFLTGFAGGPGAATQQQAQRSAQTERLFGAQERQVNLQSQLAQQGFQNQLSEKRFGLQRERLELDANKPIINFDSKTGQLTIINPRQAQKLVEAGQDASPAIFSQTIGGIANSPNFEQTFNELKQRLQLTPEEEISGKAALLEAQEKNSITPISSFFTKLTAERARDNRQKKTLGRPSFLPLVDSNGNITGAFNTKTSQVVSIRAPEDMLADLRKSGKGSEIKKIEANASNGLFALATVERIIREDPNALLKESLPFAPGARTLRAARKEVKDVLQRLRTGAAINSTEEAFYEEQLPGPLDSAETVAFKLNLFRRLFTRLGGTVEADNFGFSEDR